MNGQHHSGDVSDRGRGQHHGQPDDKWHELQRNATAGRAVRGAGSVPGARPAGRRAVRTLRFHIGDRRGRQRVGDMGDHHQQTNAVGHQSLSGQSGVCRHTHCSVRHTV